MNIRQEIIRFFIAGTIAGAIDFGVYYFLIHFFSFNLAKGISFVCAGSVAYAFNKYWIFERNPASYAQIRRYILINLLALEINVLANQGVLTLRPGAVIEALIIASMVTGVFTFASFKWWVFKFP